MRIPQYENRVSPSHQGDNYLTAHNIPDAWGIGIAQATRKLGESAALFAKNFDNISKDIQQTKAIELSNYIDLLEKEELSDPENGYYSKLGKDAMRNPDDPLSGANGVLLSIDDKIKQKQKELGLTFGYGLKMAELVKARKMDMLYRSATAHELKQTKAYGETQNQLLISNAIQKGILHRDNDNDIIISLNNGKAAILNNSQAQHWDNATTIQQLQKFESDFHSALIQQYINDNSLKASEYFEKNKDKILPESQLKLQNSLKNNELKYVSKSLSDNLFLMYPDNEEQAIAELDNKNLTPDEYDITFTKLKQKYSEKKRLYNQSQNDMVDNFYEQALPYIQQSQSIPIDLIPEELEAKTKISLMSFINSNGNPKTDDSIWEELYTMKVNNAQGFAALNLNNYRGYLSDSEYKQFLKDQETIRAGKFYSYIKDDDKMIKEALDSLGLKGGKQDSAFSEIRAMVREFEARKGRQITDDELNNLTNSLGYKGSDGTKIYKELEKGMSMRTGFIRDVMNDFVYYQSKHNGEMPSDEEKYKIIQKRINNTAKEQNEKLYQDLTFNQNRINGDFNGRRVTSPYGLREAPKKGASTNHKGIDLAYKMNEPFTAFESGVVTAKGSSPSLGNYVSIKDENGFVHQYGHANFISVRMGQKINKGDVIGKAGSTGISTGPHLHYAVLKNGEFINPFSLNSDINDNPLTVAAENNNGWAF